MSSYDPPEETEDGSSYDPGVTEREITDQREFSDLTDDFDIFDYALFGILLGIPAAILTALLVTILFPEYQETAGEILRWLGERIGDLLLTHLAMFDLALVYPTGGWSSRISNRAPPSELSVTRIVHPCASATCFTIDNPNPVPSFAVE